MKRALGALLLALVVPLPLGACGPIPSNYSNFCDELRRQEQVTPGSLSQEEFLANAQKLRNLAATLTPEYKAAGDAYLAAIQSGDFNRAFASLSTLQGACSSS